MFFAFIIILVTFFTPSLGFVGLMAILFVNGLANLLGFNKETIQEGVYGFNALLLGLAMAHEYKISLLFWVLFVFSCLLLLILTVGFHTLLSRISVPFLSLPFLFTFWIVVLATSSFTKLEVNNLNYFTTNHLLIANQNPWVAFWHTLDNYLTLPTFIYTFFQTLSGILFQNSIIGGILILFGMLIHSRIAFSLSIIGFSTAYIFYALFGVDVLDLNYHLVGSNYIFMAISLGCFYIIPNAYSYITVVLLTPLLMLLLISSNKVLALLGLNGFTFAFVLIVIGFLYFLHQRWLSTLLHAVEIQYYSPEKSIYNFVAALERYKDFGKAKFRLPFWGKWNVSQGYEGGITHLGPWAKALDFVITDDEQKSYQTPGIKREEFYCYNKPVLAVADAYVYDIVSHVEENDISDVNTEQNWGNTIVLNHLNGIYSQVSHLKKDSIKVAIGDFVSAGALLATCGNSGRSPEPHIHFQFQLDPAVGAVTYAYPFAYFIEDEQLKIFDIPKEGSTVSHVETDTTLFNAFDFKPGKKIKLKNEQDELIEWEVLTDAWNRSYLFCKQTKSIAYFINDGTMFYFTEFMGNKKSLLFTFYLAAYKVMLSTSSSFLIEDKFSVASFGLTVLNWLQDFVAPFYIFTQHIFESQVLLDRSDDSSKTLVCCSTIKHRFLGMTYAFKKANIRINENSIESIAWVIGDKKSNYVWLD